MQVASRSRGQADPGRQGTLLCDSSFLLVCTSSNAEARLGGILSGKGKERLVIPPPALVSRNNFAHTPTLDSSMIFAHHPRAIKSTQICDLNSGEGLLVVCLLG